MKKSLWTLFLVLVSVFAGFADKTIYVAPSIQGNGDGTSAANACKIKTATTTANLAASGTTTIVFPSNATFQVTTSDGDTPANGCVLIANTVTKKIIFEGNNSIILGSSGTAVRLLRLGTGSDIELRNLTFRNGTSTGTLGGGVFFGGTNLIMTGCTFDNCTADYGAAFASRGTNVTIRNCYFMNNKLVGGNYGCAVTNTGTATGGTFIIENTTFTNNTGGAGKATYGTAICTAYDGYGSPAPRGYLNTITISNCTFYKNLSGLTTNPGYASVYLDELSSGTTTATFVNNTFYGNSNCGIYIKGIKQSVKLVNNVIIGDSWATISGSGYNDHGIIAEKNVLTDLRPAIVAYNNYIVAKGAISTTITELSSGSNGNTFVTTTAQSSIDAAYLNSSLSATSIPYLTITNSSSPLLNTGISTLSGVTIPSTDITGFQRTPNYTLGAYQATLYVANGATQTINQDVNLLSTIVKPTGKLTLAAGKTLTTATLTIRSDASGTGTFVDNGGTLTATSTTIKQYLNAARNWYISSPINTATAQAAYTFYSRDEANNAWLTMTTGDALNIGQGYIAKLVSGTDSLSFSGTLNTGAKSITVNRTAAQTTKPGFNLVGNPYPSYLNARTLINSTANLERSIWYRTQIKNSSTYNFDTYNTAGGLGTNNTLNNPFVIGTIPPMQAFWVRVSPGQTSATLNFSNALRSHANDTVNPLKTKALQTSVQAVLRLQLTNGINTDEAVIYANQDASNDYDAFDSQKMSNGSAEIPEIYTTVSGEKLAINGLTDFADGMELPIGFAPGKSGSFSIQASEISNLSNSTLILKDKLLNTEFDLSNADIYSFNSDDVSTENRFAILFKSKSTSTDVQTLSDIQKISVYASKGQIIIDTNLNQFDSNATIMVNNCLGQTIRNCAAVPNRMTIASNLTSGVYFVVLKYKGQSLTKKLIVQ